MLRTIGLAVACALISLATHCAPLAAQTAAKPASGALETKTSRVYILVEKSGFGHVHGVEGRLRSGSVKLDAKASAGQVVFDMTSFVADTDAARKYVGLTDSTSASTQKQVTDNMLGVDVLDVKKFPTATFDVDSAALSAKTSATGNRIYELRGTFQLHGVRQPLIIEAEAIAADAKTRLRGKFVIQQSKFGIKPYSTALGAVGVADNLTIWGDIDVAK